MLPALAEFGVDVVIVQYGKKPPRSERLDGERPWVEDGALFVLGANGKRKMIADGLGDRVESVTSNTTHVCVVVQSFEETRLFRKRGSTFREVEMPDFGMPVIDAAIIDDVLVARLFSGPNGEEPPEEMNALLDNMQIVIIGYDLAAREDRWQWDYPFDGGMIEPWKVSRTHVYEPKEGSDNVWAIRARDGRVVSLDDSLVYWPFATGALFRRRSTGLALLNEQRCAVDAVIVTDDDREPSGIDLGDGRVLVLSKSATTLLDHTTRRVLAANTHQPTTSTASIARDGDRWKVILESHHSTALSPASEAQAARWEKPISQLEVSDETLSRTLDRIAASPASASVDEARWRAISQTIEEEGDAIESARERLVAQKIISAAFDPREIAVSAKRGSADRHRWWLRITDEPELKLLWATIAHDEQRVSDAIATIEEFSQRVRRIDATTRPHELEFSIDASADESLFQHFPGSAVRMLSDVVRTSSRDLDRTQRIADPTLFALRAHALWRIAAARGLTIPPGYNPTLTGVAFADVRSPFEPLLSLASLGYTLRGFGANSVVLSLPLFTALHEPERALSKA